MRIKRLAQIVFCLWIAAMLVVWGIFRNEPQCYDACRFIRNAIINWNNGTLYPSHADLYQDYITAVGYTNLLQLIHLLFGNVGWMQIVNLVMNIGIVCEMFYIARKLFSSTTGYIAMVMYCLMTTNLFPFLQLTTEIPYLFLALSGFTLCTRVACSPGPGNHAKVSDALLLAIAGISFALAHTMRPLELALLVPMAIYMCYTAYKSKDNNTVVWKKASHRLAALLLPYFIVLLGIGLFFKHQSGVFCNGAMTGWYNLVRSTDDKHPVSNSWTTSFEKGGIAYVADWEHTTVMERNAVFRDASLKWIAHHPLKYAAIYAVRAVKLWGADYFYIPDLTGYDNLTVVEKMENPRHASMIRRMVEICYSAVWYVVFLFFLIGIVKMIRQKSLVAKGVESSGANILLLLSIIVFGTLGTALFPVEIRYHYPYTWAMTILGAETLRQIILSRQQKDKSKASLQTRA